MKIYLLDRNSVTTEQWQRYFAEDADVEVVNMYFEDFMNSHDVECVVSPANSYGLMDGGYDRAISEYFGWDLMKVVQKRILDECFGDRGGNAHVGEMGAVAECIRLDGVETLRQIDVLQV